METIDCTNCNQNFNSRMRSCPFCGAQRSSEPYEGEPSCPRCGGSLEAHIYREQELDHCEKCGGLWLDSDEFQVLTTEKDVYADDKADPLFRKQPLEPPSGYLPCARCRKPMVRQNFKRISGVLVDICGDHGAWMDAGELEQIRSFIASGGLDGSQDKEIETAKVEIQSLARQVKDVRTMHRILNKWKFKRWMLEGF